ncbi:hypothetical protein KP509_04G096200 [Ceratopteris richardii]|nr:hypothetical protein KP509_04G096200 [Ceratopteris richardii]
MLTWNEQAAMATHQLAACSVLPSSSRPASSACCKTELSRCYVPRSPLRFLSRASSSTGDAVTEVSKDDGLEEEAETDAKQSGEDDDFEERLAKIRRRSNSGTGTKAAKRKARKSGDYTSLASTGGKGKAVEVFLPPVPLKDPISDGLPVALGFNSYTERINGRFAALGLAAVLLVELATGSSFLKYHESSVIGLQAYTMLAASAIFIKYEKEKISVWPKRKD